MKTEVVEFDGAAGRVDCAFDWPDGEPRGWALILHPHPLQGGARDNKVVTTLGRACLQAGLAVLRPNFRGVGASEGEFDSAVGETDDMQAVLAQVRQRYPALAGLPWVLGGFSFGTAVAAQLYSGLPVEARPGTLMLAGTAVWRFLFRELDLPAHTLLIHGESDDVVPLADALDWARPLNLPTVVVPGATHFFHGKLLILRDLVQQRLRLDFP